MSRCTISPKSGPGSPTVTRRGRGTRSRAEIRGRCDGDHGVCSASVPEGAMTVYSYHHGIGWLTVLADVPAPRLPLLAVSRAGFAAHFPRGPQASRFYLECAPDDKLESWPDERVWPSLERNRPPQARSAASAPVSDIT